MAALGVDYESVAISSRIRLARNFKDFPFPGKLLRDPHAEEQASEMIRLLAGELTSMEDFKLYVMSETSNEEAALLEERHLISRDLIKHRSISAALISTDESISVMINEEDHIREQYFIRGFDLMRAYERISGIDDTISDSIPFAYDGELGYLTACPTNLGTGLRASVMLFLPACVRRDKMRRFVPVLTRLGLTVRGAYGEGSGAFGDLFQISNEVTLGFPEEDILSMVQRAVETIVEAEFRERARMKVEGGLALKDSVFRSLGILSTAKLLSERELLQRLSDVKLGVVLGYFKEAEDAKKGKRGFHDSRLARLDALAVSARDAALSRRMQTKEEGKETDAFRAEYVSSEIGRIELI